MPVQHHRGAGRRVAPDPRLDVLSKLAKSAKIVPTQLTFVDIAAWRGGSREEGLGNQFLANIREVDAIALWCCFEDEDVTHVEAALIRSPISTP